jgi:hypothetical protein
MGLKEDFQAGEAKAEGEDRAKKEAMDKKLAPVAQKAGYVYAKARPIRQVAGGVAKVAGFAYGAYKRLPKARPPTQRVAYARRPMRRAPRQVVMYPPGYQPYAYPAPRRRRKAQRKQGRGGMMGFGGSGRGIFG